MGQSKSWLEKLESWKTRFIDSAPTSTRTAATAMSGVAMLFKWALSVEKRLFDLDRRTDYVERKTTPEEYTTKDDCQRDD